MREVQSAAARALVDRFQPIHARGGARGAQGTAVGRFSSKLCCPRPIPGLQRDDANGARRVFPTQPLRARAVPGASLNGKTSRRSLPPSSEGARARGYERKGFNHALRRPGARCEKTSGGFLQSATEETSRRAADACEQRCLEAIEADLRTLGACEGDRSDAKARSARRRKPGRSELTRTGSQSGTRLAQQ